MITYFGDTPVLSLDSGILVHLTLRRLPLRHVVSLPCARYRAPGGLLGDEAADTSHMWGAGWRMVKSRMSTAPLVT